MCTVVQAPQRAKSLGQKSLTKSPVSSSDSKSPGGRTEDTGCSDLGSLDQSVDAGGLLWITAGVILSGRAVLAI